MAAPERLGKYLIRRELGRGAMGVVYEGYDPMIERAVAIKVLRLDESNPHLAQELRTRFRREAQAAGRLGHPGIVAVYEYDEDAATQSTFIAMELVRGRDLKSLFDAGKRFAPEETGRMMEALLAALQHAHERGVVHRDIKPGNIILLDSGGVKIADFGIAKLDTSELTQLGSVLGTVSHMSPEQLTGDAIDGRSDLYSCGVILYQLLTGERPFTGTPAALMHKVLHEVPPPPSLRVPHLPPALDEVVLTAMAKQPAERYRDANAFGAALRAALAQVADAEATVVLPPAATSDPASRTVPPGTWVPATSMPGTSPGVVASQAPEPRGVSSERVATPGAPAAGTLAAGSSTTLQPGTFASGPAASPSVGSRRWVAAALGVASLLAAGAVAYRTLGPRLTGEPTVLARAPGPSVASIPSSEGGGAASATATPPAASGAAPDAAAQVPTAAAAALETKATPVPAAASTASVRPMTPAPAPAPASKPRSATSVAAAPTAPPPTGSAALPVPPPATNAGARPSTRSADPAFSSADMRAPGEARPASEPRDSRVARTERRPAVPPSATPASGQGPARNEVRPEPGNATRPAAAPASPAPNASAAMARSDADCIEEARRGDARCQLVLAGLYRSGRGVPRDPTEAARWYRKAAEQGSDVGQYELGLLYESGIGVAKDPITAVSWYRKAAAQGNPRAQNRMGVAYENGIAGPAKLVLAADWYRKAADQELPIAEYNLGRLYLSGGGVFQNAAKGRALLQKAADRGEPNAMVHLAEMSAKGGGQPRDREQSLQLYRDALARPGLTDRNRELATRALAAAR